MPGGDRNPVAIFDLDGTILRINSFPRWVLHLIAGRVPELGLRRRLVLSLSCQWHLLLRKLRRMDHDTLLRHLQTAWRSAAARETGRFEAKLLRHVRPNLAAVLEVVAAERVDAILATAAAEEYAAGLGRRLGFRHVLATSTGRRADEPCNSGERKRDRVLALLDQQGWRGRPLMLFTDHIDDLPLMRECDIVFWYGSEAEMARAAVEAPGTRVAFCRDLDCATMLDACLPVISQSTAARESMVS
jgi:phosphoserine phosphatase